MAEANIEADLQINGMNEGTIQANAAENVNPNDQDLNHNADSEQDIDRIVENNRTDEEESDEPKQKVFTFDEIQGLLLKAINFHAPLEDVRTVIKCGGDVNKPIKNGLHALHYAAYVDNHRCFKLLLDNGANVNSTDDIGYTPLHLTARCGHYKTMEILLQNGAIVNFNDPGEIIHNTGERNKLGYTTTEPLNLAIQNSHIECVKLLMKNGARADNKYFMGNEICLCPLDKIDCLEILLQHGADPNVFNRCGLSPLMKACKYHHIDAVRLLLSHNADVNATCPPLFEQKSALTYAIHSGNIVIINLLLSKKADISRHSDYKYSALHTGVMKGRADICRLLLQYKADVNERTSDGATALMLACGTPDLQEREEIVKMLLNCGADVNAHAPGFCYFDPYLSPLTEYLKIVGFIEAFNIVRSLIRHGARIHYSSGAMGLNRLPDPYAILPFVHCMKNSVEMFEFTMVAATRFNPLAIYAADLLSDEMKDTLLLVATQPRDLKHLTRQAIRQYLTPGIQANIKELPLPSILKTYLQYK